MKKIFTLCIAFTSMMTLGAQNLLTNGGMEDWESDSKPAEWTTAPAADIAYSKESSIKSEGSNSIKVAHTGTKGTGKIYLGNVPITPGKTYKYSFKYYVDAASTNAAGIRYWGYWNNAAKDNFAEPNKDLQQTDYLATTEHGAWINFEKEFVAPAGAETIQLEVRFYKGTTVYVDDIQLTTDSGTTGINLIDNDEAKIYTTSGCINILSNKSNDLIEVYDVLGKQIAKQKANLGLNTLQVKAGQILIVKVNNKAIKIVTE